MRVRKAACAGACYGVQRALDMADEAARENTSVQTLGPLIHNPQVVSQMQQRGVTVAHDVEDVHAETVIVRSHGITPIEMRSLKATGAHVVDATCPHVLRAQKAAAKLAQAGLTVLVMGEKSHPEVEGLCAWVEEMNGSYFVVGCVEEIPDNLPDKVGIVVQTTQARATFDDICAQLAERGIHAEIRDTICSATASRQQAAAELAAQVDAMVIIGGHNSSNTTRLYEICRDIVSSYHVESADDLQRGNFEGCSVIGVTAGASTPEDQIDAVVNLLESW